MHRRELCQIALTGATLAFLGGCGSGNKGQLSDTGNGELPLGELVRVDLGRSPFPVTSFVMNARGDIGITREILTPGPHPAYCAYLLTSTANWQAIHPPEARNSGIAAMNDRGQVVVFGVQEDYYATNPRKRAFLYSEGTFTEIRSDEPDILSVEVGAIAEDGTVTGSFYQWAGSGDNRQQKAFFWRDGVMTTLPGIEVVSTNNYGQLIFSFWETPGGRIHWMLRQADGTLAPLRELHPLDADFIPKAIDDSGDIIGNVYKEGENRGMAIVRNGAFYLQPPETGFQSLRTRNSARDTLTSPGPPQYLIRHTGERIDLTPLYPSEASAYSSITAINDRGQMIGKYQSWDPLRSGADMVFLLTPPAAIPATGSATVSLSRLRHSSVDGSHFVVDAVTGALLTPNFLEVEIVARPNTSGTRRIRITLNRQEEIEVGLSYGVADPTYGFSMGVRVNLIGVKTPNGDTLFQLRGVILINRITEKEVVFRLVDVEVGPYASLYLNPPADVKINATVTIRR